MRQILVQRMIYILPNLGSGRERDFCVVSMWHVRLMALRVVYLTDGRTRMWARLEFCCGPVVQCMVCPTCPDFDMVCSVLR